MGVIKKKNAVRFMRLCTYMSSKTECLSLSLFVENSRCAYRRHEICKTRARRQAGRTDCRSSGGAVTSRRWEVAAYFFFFCLSSSSSIFSTNIDDTRGISFHEPFITSGFIYLKKKKPYLRFGENTWRCKR